MSTTILDWGTKMIGLIPALLGGLTATIPPATEFDFGTVMGSSAFSGTIMPNEVLWFSVVLDGSETHLDISLSSSTFLDSEIGLYDAFGFFIASDDDDGIGLGSTLSFGTGSGLSLGDAFNLGGDGIADGEDGSQPAAGTYYIALGEFNVDFGSTDFDVISDGPDNGGEYTITVYANSIPSPHTSLVLAGICGLAHRRRSR